MKNILMSKEVPNSLGEETEWESHESIFVTVCKKYTFNGNPVLGVISIQEAGSAEEIEDFREDGDPDNITGDEILTTAKGARALAAALIEAADKADTEEIQPRESGVKNA